MKKLAYDVILFEKCNMKCDHCFQLDHTRDWNIEIINTLPEIIFNNFKQQFQLRNNNLNLLTISFCGGELFADGLDDSRFDIYRQLKNNIVNRIRTLYSQQINFEMISNGVFTKTQRVIDFLKDTESKISISYDPVCRYRSKTQKQLALNNISLFNKLGLLDEISITLTKPSINYYIDNDDMKQFAHLNVGINYFIASSDNNVNLVPTDDDYFRFWKYCYNHQYDNIKAYKQLLDNIKYQEKTKFCICDDRLIVRNGVITYNCAIYSSGFTNVDFYKKATINEQNVRFVKKTLGENKRGCDSCEHFSICPGMCWTSILHKSVTPSTSCPVKRIIDHIKNVV